MTEWEASAPLGAMDGTDPLLRTAEVMKRNAALLERQRERARAPLPSTVAAWNKAMFASQRTYAWGIASSEGQLNRVTVAPTTCGGVRLADVEKLQRRLRWRRSRFAWKRRRAYAACLAMIRFREAALMLS